MSPRSAEFFAMARERLGASRTAVDAGFPSAAVSLAYYAMLYAARAALSESERNAKSHRGTWDLFHELVVASGGFDADLAAEARNTQRPREAADYDARTVEPAEAEDLLALAERFVAAVDELLTT